MTKTLCKTQNAEKLQKKQQNPKFGCSKCGRSARKKKHLCKPVKLK